MCLLYDKYLKSSATGLDMNKETKKSENFPFAQKVLQQQVNAFTNAPFLLFEKAYSLNTYWGLKSARIFFCEEVANAKHFFMIILCKIDIRNGLNVGIFFLRLATLRFNFQGRRGLERFFAMFEGIVSSEYRKMKLKMVALR